MIYCKSSENMSELKDNSVDLIVTSPPYFNKKDYGRGQIGLGDTYVEYFGRLLKVMKECHRVLKEGKRLVVNIGDVYVASTKEKPYHLLPVPSGLIYSLTRLGFDYLTTITWRKVGTVKPSGGNSFMGSMFYPSNPIIETGYEAIIIFRKKGNSKPQKDIMSKIALDEWQEICNTDWRFVGKKQGSHPAMFPLELPYRVIKLFSFVGDTVLDPFMGSGTTGLAAEILGRKWVGYELNKGYIHEAKFKIKGSQSYYFEDYYHLLREIEGWGFNMVDVPQLEGILVDDTFVFWAKEGRYKRIKKYLKKYQRVLCVTKNDEEKYAKSWAVIPMKKLSSVKNFILKEDD